MNLEHLEERLLKAKYLSKKKVGNKWKYVYSRAKGTGKKLSVEKPKIDSMSKKKIIDKFTKTSELSDYAGPDGDDWTPNKFSVNALAYLSKLNPAFKPVLEAKKKGKKFDFNKIYDEENK